MAAKCSSRKIEYRTEARANLALAVHPPNWEAYQCPECNWWHLTSKTARCWSCGDPLAGDVCVNDSCGVVLTQEPKQVQRKHLRGARGMEPEEPDVWAGLWDE